MSGSMLQAVEKMTKPISHFRYGTYDKFKNKCFISVAVDGTEEGVSAAKSMSVIFPNTGGNGAAATSSATAGLVAVPPDEKKEKGQKRNREERPPPEPRVFEPQEMVRGCVVDIKGLPPNVNYGRLKELLNGCGKVKFLQLLKVPKPSKEPPQKKAKVEEDSPPKRSHPLMAWKGLPHNSLLRYFVGQREQYIETYPDNRRHQDARDACHSKLMGS
eukprot:s1114_g14.t1